MEKKADQHPRIFVLDILKEFLILIWVVLVLPLSFLVFFVLFHFDIVTKLVSTNW